MRKKSKKLKYNEIPQLMIGKADLEINNGTGVTVSEQIRELVSNVIEEEFAVHSKWFQNWLEFQWDTCLQKGEECTKNNPRMSQYSIVRLKRVQSWKEKANLMYGSIDNALIYFKKENGLVQ